MTRSLFFPPFVSTMMVLGLVFGWMGCKPAGALEADEVLVVVNDSDPISVAIGDYYQMVRAIPPANVFHLPAGTTTAETISRATYNSSVRDPIQSYLQTSGLRFQVLCIVLTKGVPLRVSSGGAVGVNQLRASVDSELAYLFSGQVPDEGQAGRLGNPHFQSTFTFDNFRGTSNLYLVTRLTGYQTNLDGGTGVPSDIKALIDRAQGPADPGTYLLDADPSAFQEGNGWLLEARNRLQELGAPVTHDPSTTFQCNHSAISGYAGWGSNDHADPGPPYYGEVPGGSGNIYPGTFAKGALTTTFVSTSARTFTDGSQNYGQSLVADLIRHGATGSSGHVYEPFLDAVPRPQILFDRWELGYQAGEAFSMATPFLSWENVIVVDPMARRDDFDPPEVISIVPDAGPITGGTRLTITGSNFYAQVKVFFGALSGIQVSRTSTTEIEVTVPEGVSLGAVDVRLENAYGEHIATGGFEYEPLPIALSSMGSPRIGRSFQFVITGPEGADVALLVDKERGPTKIGNLCLDLGFTNQLRIVYDGIRGLDPSIPFPGELLIPFSIPNRSELVFLTFHAQAVLKTGMAQFELTNRFSSSIFP